MTKQEIIDAVEFLSKKYPFSKYGVPISVGPIEISKLDDMKFIDNCIMYDYVIEESDNYGTRIYQRVGYILCESIDNVCISFPDKNAKNKRKIKYSSQKI